MRGHREQIRTESYILEAIHEFKHLVDDTKKLIEIMNNDLKEIINMDDRYDHNLHMAQYNKRKRIRNKYAKRLLK